MKKLLALLVAIIAFAFCVWIYQIILGLGVTGMNKPAFWGLYIVTFVFFIGISAGGIAVASLSHLGGIEKFKPVSRISEVVAIISLIMAMLAITFDLGRPDRLLHLFIYPHLISPIIWDIAVINIYLVLCIAMLIFSIKGNKRWLKIFATISIPAFVLVHSITAWIFGLIKSQPGWHSSILAPLFIVSALVSGLGLIILALIFSKKLLPGFNIEDDVVISLGGYLKILLPLLFYFLFSEFLTIIFAGVPAHIAVLKGLFTQIFWFDIVLGIFIPFFIIISKFGKTVKGVGLASLLACIGVFVERINIVLPSLYHPYLLNDRILYGYKPTWVEYSLVGGLFALGIALFITASKLIPIFEDGGKR